MGAILNNILAYVSLVNKELTYLEKTETHYEYVLKGYLLPKIIMDKNNKIPLKERKTYVRLDINQQNIGMYDYTMENFGYGIKFKLPISNFPFKIEEEDVLTVTGTFQK